MEYKTQGCARSVFRFQMMMELQAEKAVWTIFLEKSDFTLVMKVGAIYLDYIGKIKELAEKACSLHVLNYNASTDKDKLFNPPATLQQIKEFEQEIGMTLPIPLVRYLTELGNGGVGADYGIWSIDEMREQNDPATIRNDLPPMIDHSLTDAQWRQFAETYLSVEEKMDNVSEDEYKHLTEQLEEMQSQMKAGGIFISTPGCTMLSILMCHGNAKGEVFVLDFDYMDQVYSEPKSCGKFEDWIINDLQKRIDKVSGGNLRKRLCQSMKRILKIGL